MDGSIAGSINYQIRRIICSTACRLLLFRSRARPMGFRWRVTYSLDVECPHVFVLTLGWQDDAIEGTRWKRNGNLVRWEEGRWDFFRFFRAVLCFVSSRCAWRYHYYYPRIFFSFVLFSFFFFFFFVVFFLRCIFPSRYLFAFSLFFICLFSEPFPIRYPYIIPIERTLDNRLAHFAATALHPTHGVNYSF